jgi:hypothetical protein
MSTSVQAEIESFEARSANAAKGEAIFAALGRLDRLLEVACDAAEQVYGAMTDGDPYRGFYVSPQDFRQLLGRPPGAPLLYVDERIPDSVTLFAQLQQAFGLSAFDVDALLIAVAPEIDLRYQRLFAYLQDDITRKRPSVDLALNLLCPTPEAKLQGRSRFESGAPLIRNRLLHIASSSTAGAPFLARDLEIDDAVVSALVTEATIDRRIQAFTIFDAPTPGVSPLPSDAPTAALAEIVTKSRAEGRPLIFHFRGPRNAGQRQAALALAQELGRGLLSADCRVAAGADVDFLLAGGLLFRDAALHQAIPCLDGVDALRAAELQSKRAALWASMRHALDVVIVISELPWAFLRDTPGAPEIDVVSLDFAMPDFEQRLSSWREALGGAADNTNGVVESLAGRFRLSLAQIRAAAASARSQARLGGGHAALKGEELLAAARGQSVHRLGALARQVRPKCHLGDLVLPDDAIAQLQEVCNQVRQRHVVYDRWGFDRKLSLGKGVNVLFSGPPGVGKTMAAEAFANELGLDLFKVDLSQIVNKYIGETEKNLNRVFEEARASNVILFFDEADALFGKRSEVRDSHDRYANIEIAYLLQKMEEYEGLSVLATNLKQNLDEAFTRRLSFIIDFPFPDEESRFRIWSAIWPEDVPVGDVDFGYMARTFRLSGGSIKNVAVAAAFLAAESGESVQTGHLVRATRREFQKMGKTVPGTNVDHYTTAASAVAS